MANFSQTLGSCAFVLIIKIFFAILTLSSFFPCIYFLNSMIIEVTLIAMKLQKEFHFWNIRGTQLPWATLQVRPCTQAGTVQESLLSFYWHNANRSIIAEEGRRPYLACKKGGQLRWDGTPMMQYFPCDARSQMTLFGFPRKDSLGVHFAFPGRDR